MDIKFLTGLSGAKRVIIDSVYVGYVTLDLEFIHDVECNIYVSHETKAKIISKMQELQSGVKETDLSLNSDGPKLSLSVGECKELERVLIRCNGYYTSDVSAKISGFIKENS